MRLQLAGALLATIMLIPSWLRTATSDDAIPPNTGTEIVVSPLDMILVVGAEGETQYGEAFRQWANRWQQTAVAAGATITAIGWDNDQSAAIDVGSQAADQAVASESNAAPVPSDLDLLRRTIASLEPTGQGAVWVVLMGHGTASQSGAKFNLRGPDISAEELGRLLQPITRPVVVVNAFSSSGPFINALSGPNRIIVTATQSGTEQNYSRFGDYLSQAIGDPASDIDHDGEVSILEAFLAAAGAVRDYYRSANQIQTETALIDDNGDSRGTPSTAFRGIRAAVKSAQADQAVDGSFAVSITLASQADRLELTADEIAKRDSIEAELRALPARQSELGETEYRQATLSLLLELARIYQAAQQRAEPASSPED